ncbi:Rad52/22 family double-strand break repair protein [Anaerospora hongkongensis]|uniref:Rad52/22 family double-strand break repair protein n=1 Tax=Anaerospora hongkongensis TaxID=244830 RepID=A0A4R1Q230_9FIRM|nr:Rad52/Rad22 family DNA repair protein [Anaerospora hongkongensis]TCL40029.1 Rad52/22 family double-strand break repair protein [Anaerospora hongkongensis]
MQDDIKKKLQEPFLPSEVEWRVGATTADKLKGIALAYVTNRAIQTRLDEVFGPFGWKNEYREWKANSQLCGISILHNGEWITKWDGANDSATEATKGGLSDSMKRAAVQWGIGRYLYELENEWVPIEPYGKNSFKLKSTPRLPLWALPEGFSYDKKPVHNSALAVTAAATPILTNKASSAPTTAGDVAISNKGTMTKLSDLDIDQLRWLANNAKNEVVRSAAKACLAELNGKMDNSKPTVEAIFGGEAV